MTTTTQLDRIEAAQAALGRQLAELVTLVRINLTENLIMANNVDTLIAAVTALNTATCRRRRSCRSSWTASAASTPRCPAPPRRSPPGRDPYQVSFVVRFAALASGSGRTDVYSGQSRGALRSGELTSVGSSPMGTSGPSPSLDFHGPELT